MGQNGQIHKIDICGQICPSCLLIALKEVTAQRDLLLRGGALHIHTDSRQAINTIPSSVHNMGYQTNIVKSKGRYCIEIQKA